jgi:hypothetical protein
MAHENQSLRRATSVYETLLRLYPRSHRQAYGPLMVQLFRDQYRDACRLGKPRSSSLWLRTLADVVRSALREQLTQQIHDMKNISLGTLSLILFVVGVGTPLVALSLLSGQPGLALVLAYVSALALSIRAVVEWKRPPEELIRSLCWAAALAIIFGFILPAWVNAHLPRTLALFIPPILLGGLPPLIKAGVRTVRMLS